MIETRFYLHQLFFKVSTCHRFVAEEMFKGRAPRNHYLHTGSMARRECHFSGTKTRTEATGMTTRRGNVSSNSIPQKNKGIILHIIINKACWKHDISKMFYHDEKTMNFCSKSFQYHIKYFPVDYGYVNVPLMRGWFEVRTFMKMLWLYICSVDLNNPRNHVLAVWRCHRLLSVQIVCKSRSPWTLYLNSLPVHSKQ